MESRSVPAPAPADRVLAHVQGDESGPSIILVGGLHGNEPAGVEALRRVAARLPGPGTVRGEVLAVAGNVAALAGGVRYIDTDMNRGWWLEAHDSGREGGSEDRERHELLAVMEPVLDRATEPVIVLDFHTTSGGAPPFITLGDTLRNRAFASAFPLPVVLGVEEQLAGTFLEYVNNRGCVTLGCEGGRHDDPAAADHLEAVAWLALARAGNLEPDALPAPDPHAFLERVAAGHPRVVEVRYRHAVPRDRRFRMEPGFQSFQRIEANQKLGEWDDGELVHARESGRVLMPLYQSQGDDGFFIIRDVHPLWLRASALLRRIRADRLAPLLPGVRRHPYIANAVIVDRQVARWFTVEIFHLLGFRRKIDQGHTVIMARRHFDEPSNWR